jgi:hypothetical protein
LKKSSEFIHICKVITFSVLKMFIRIFEQKLSSQLRKQRYYSNGYHFLLPLKQKKTLPSIQIGFFVAPYTLRLHPFLLSFFLLQYLSLAQSIFFFISQSPLELHGQHKIVKNILSLIIGNDKLKLSLTLVAYCNKMMLAPV